LDGTIKLIDFGLARHVHNNKRPLTGGVCTRWYRPPEILFGAEYYGSSVDVWSVGCILAELFLGDVIFKGLGMYDNNKNNEDQLSKIFGIRGTPNEENWPQANRLKDYKAFQNTEAIPLRDLIANASADAVDLMEKMLQLNPNDRISLGEALKHPFLTKNVPSKGQVSYRQH